MLSRLVLPAVPALLANALSAQLTWREIGAQLTPRHGHYAFFDEVRGRVTVFGGQTTPTAYTASCWQLEDSDWMEVPSGLTARARGAACEDPASPGNALLFGGRLDNGRVLDETVGFDGQTLRMRAMAPRSTPSARWNTAMVCDIGRSRAVLFGGTDAVGLPLSDTWEWDGTGWQQRDPLQRPPALSHHAMAYDATRQTVVLFGGLNVVSRNWTWLYDGTTWREQQPAVNPRAVHNCMLAFDAERRLVVLFGGRDDAGRLSDETWHWDGVAWRGPMMPATRPPARELATLTWDKQRKVMTLVGGQGQGGTLLGDAWTWDGTNWRELRPRGQGTLVVPPGRTFPVLAYREQGNRITLFGGYVRQGIRDVPLTDVWESDGHAWQQRTPVRSPPPAFNGAGTAHRGTGELCYLPGSDTFNNPLNEQWSWNGSSWSVVALNTPVIPSLRHQVLGSLQSSQLGWVLARLVTSGTAPFFTSTLQLIVPNTGTVQTMFVPGGPGARVGMTLAQAHEAAVHSERVWVFGGATGDGSAFFNDVWELSDTGSGGNLVWTQLMPASGSQLPPARRDAACSYVQVMDSLVVAGGFDGSILADAWQFHLPTRQWYPLQGVGSRSGAAMTTVPRVLDRHTSGLLFGGTSNGSDAVADPWLFTATLFGPETRPFVPASRPTWSGSLLIHDRGNRRSIAFGGDQGFSGFYVPRPPIWSYDGTTWTPLVTSGSEVPGGGGVACFDEAHSAMVLFGASRSRNTFALSRDGVWSRRTINNGPVGVTNPAMTYVASRRQCILVGGAPANSGFANGETWAFDLATNQWSLLTVAPFVRLAHGMADDRLRDRLVLFGGAVDGSYVPLDETWEYHSSTGWLRRTPVHKPSARFPLMAYDESRGRVVVFGGYSTGRLTDVWEWDGNDWAMRMPETTVSPAGGDAMTYDADRGRLLGYRAGALFEINAAVDVTGSGNTSSRESLRSYSQPVLGTTLRLGFANPQGLGLLGLAVGPMQRPLFVLGAPMCEPTNMFTQIWLGPITGLGEPNAAVALPANSALLGVVFVFQGYALQAASCFRATDALNVRFY